METPKTAILYIGPRDLGDAFAGNADIVLESCRDVGAVPETIRRPDVVLMDSFAHSDDTDDLLSEARKWLGRFPKKRFRFPPAFFVIVPDGASHAFRLDMMEAVFDEAVAWPLTPRGVTVRSRVYIRQTLVAQKHHADTASLTRSFEYLDRFKGEVSRLKTDLMEEKTGLNAALKQIQQMTAERGRLKDDLAGLKQQLAHNISGFGSILYTLIRKRVEVNQGHGERVADIACFLGKALGVDENKLEDLRKAAMLHEVGLLFLTDPSATAHSRAAAAHSQDEAEAAPGPATENNHQPTAYDKTIMMQYPVKGAELLEACPGFEACAQILKSMNEWSDGTGYPDGLKRRYIPMSSRILAGADELENLRDRDDIRDTRTLLAAMEDLAGVRLDPVIVGQLEKYVVHHMGAHDFKVRGVRIDQLEPGMTLGAALFTATGTKLFTADTVLTKDAIDKIIQYNREYPVDETVYIKV